MKMQKTELSNPIQTSPWDFVQNLTANFTLHIIARKFQSISQLILNPSFGAMKIHLQQRNNYVIFLFMDQFWGKQMPFLSHWLDLMVTTIVSVKTKSIS